MKKIVDGILKYYQILQAFMVLAVILVVFSFLNIPEKSTPKIIVNQGVIVGVYPGANSVEVEKKLTSRVKALIFSFDEVDTTKTHSFSNEGIMFMHVVPKSTVTNTHQFWSKIEKRLVKLSVSLDLDSSVKKP